LNVRAHRGVRLAALVERQAHRDEQAADLLGAALLPGAEARGDVARVHQAVVERPVAQQHQIELVLAHNAVGGTQRGVVVAAAAAAADVVERRALRRCRARRRACA
jgi:hypothetical protein